MSPRSIADGSRSRESAIRVHSHPTPIIGDGVSSGVALLNAPEHGVEAFLATKLRREIVTATFRNTGVNRSDGYDVQKMSFYWFNGRISP